MARISHDFFLKCYLSMRFLGSAMLSNAFMSCHLTESFEHTDTKENIMSNISPATPMGASQRTFLPSVISIQQGHTLATSFMGSIIGVGCILYANVKECICCGGGVLAWLARVA